MDTAAEVLNDWIQPGAKFALYAPYHGGRVHYVAPESGYAVPGGIRVQTICGKTLYRPVFIDGVEAQTTTLMGTFNGSRRVTAKFDCLDCAVAYATQMRKFKN